MKIFTEYKIKAERRAEYEAFASELQGLYPRVRVYEGVYQPGLFVEEWTDCDEAFFATLRTARRQADHPFWSQLHPLIEGGAEKAQCWLFRPFAR
jgi:hypothetical protein